MKNIETYRSLVRNIQTFLNENPELDAVTLRRPMKKPPRQTYPSAERECYGRMKETCPMVREILERALPGDTNDEIREEIFNAMHNQVTMPFRRALEQVCQQKFVLIRRLKDMQERNASALDEAITDINSPRDEAVEDREETQGCWARPVYVADVEDDEDIS
jgi:hypothetical protein